jgi:hypothetical protein
MLDQVLDFACGVNSSEIVIRVFTDPAGDKQILVGAVGAPQAITFTEQAIRGSKGGVLNDWTLQKMLNEQFGKQGNSRAPATG